jgi:DHA2 family multidrug resistance protein
VSLYRVVQASGLAFLFAPINVAAYVKLPVGRNNAASALLNVARNVGGSVGIAVATTIMARRAQVHQNFLVGHLTPYDPAYLRDLSALTRTLAHYGGSVGAPARALGVIYAMVQQQAAALAVADAFRWLGAIFLLLIPAVWLFKPYDPRGAHAGH